MDVSNVFVSGEAISASAMNQNFSDLASALSQLRTGNLATDAGITSRQLAQRFSIQPCAPIVIVPYSSSSTFLAAGGALYTPPLTLTSILKQTVRLMGGQECYLCEVELYANQSTNGGATVYTSLNVLKNSVVVGGAAVVTTGSDTYYRIRNSDPVANPLMACQDGDVIEFQLVKADGGAAIAGWSVRPIFKTELVS